MSIIFDAIKRAEAERQKSGVLPSQLHFAPAPKSRKRLWALAALFVSCGMAAWWMQQRPPSVAPTIAEQDESEMNSGKNGASVSATDPVSKNPPLAEMRGAENAPVREVDLRGASANKNVSVPQMDRPLTASAQLDPMREAIAANPAKLSPNESMKAPPPQGMPVSVPQMDRPLTASAQLTPGAQNPTSPAATTFASNPKLAQGNPDLTATQQTLQPVEVPATATLSATTATSSEALPSVFELGYEIRHELPAMALSMYVYHRQPQHSFVIIAGKKYTEGEIIDGKVQVQKIRTDGMECVFQGTRFFYPRSM
jgi:Type II secretion system protein B